VPVTSLRTSVAKVKEQGDLERDIACALNIGGKGLTKCRF